MKLSEESVLEIEDSGDDDENDSFKLYQCAVIITVFVIIFCLNWHGLRPPSSVL